MDSNNVPRTFFDRQIDLDIEKFLNWTSGFRDLGKGSS